MTENQRFSFLDEVGIRNQLIENVFHHPLPEELQMFRDVVGHQITAELARLHAPLFVFNNISAIKTRSPEANPSRVSRALLPQNRYVRTDFASIIDGRVILLNTWKKQNDRVPGPKKVAQVDFMFFHDWLSDEDAEISYLRSKKRDKIEGKGLDSDGMNFLKKLRDLILQIPEDCIVNLFPANAQRERIEKRAFAGRPNIVVHHYEDESGKKGDSPRLEPERKQRPGDSP